jgi:predicted amidohydrolase
MRARIALGVHAEHNRIVKQRLVTLGLIQMSCTGTRKENLAKALDSVAEAAKRGAQIVALPELFLGPYFCQRPDDMDAFATAESIPGPTTQALSAAAAKHRIVLIGGSIFEKTEQGRYYNTCPMFGTDGKMLGTYRKSHIPEDILYHEQRYFSPGDTGIRVVDTPYGKIASLVCFDQWFPEAARIATLRGAELLIYPTAIGILDGSVEENITGDWEGMWKAVQLGHAAANTVYVAAANRVSHEGAITFWGGSFIADPAGRITAQARDAEEILLAELDLTRVKALQEAWGFLRNRRTDLYGPLTRTTL